MRTVVFLVFSIAFSMADLDFNSKTRNFSVELLYHALQDVNEDVNVVLSPYVIWSLLASVAYETLGATREQVSKVFLLTEDRSEFVEQFENLQTTVLVNEEGVNVTSHNYLYYDEDLHLHSDSISRLEGDFSFITRNFSFKKAKEALSPFQSRNMKQCGTARMFIIKFTDFTDASMIMYNCLMFKAKWLKPFKKSEDKLKVRLRSSNFESLHASISELPYEGGKHCMLLIRPHSGYDLKQVSRKLREESLRKILSKIHREAYEFGLKEVELPEGEIKSHVILNKSLMNMGLSDVFDQNSSNFDELAEDKMYIDEIAQRVYVTFEQYEMRADAITPSFELAKPPQLRRIVVEDPFIFLIMETTTGTILFGGSYSTKDTYLMG
ncbi:serine protease inhibitor 77Ba-like [Maniola jurtina]|uniref:serine protease inhibitor 77Ba-like n=1 Tax=Maniola jurtina TaxID=191418 RepID=UPI001E68FB32|nr:serine protease inhibitor 77Ba-like [Maniola jurtina]